MSEHRDLVWASAYGAAFALLTAETRRGARHDPATAAWSAREIADLAVRHENSSPGEDQYRGTASRPERRR